MTSLVADMLVTILPFFLAARLAVDEDPEYQTSEWQIYGPECTFEVFLNMSLANVIHEKDNFCSMISSELKCRPRGSDTLNCRFVDGKIQRPDPEDPRCSNAKDFVPIKDRFVDEEPFEIRFNSRGIENLIVPRNIPRWRLDMIRVIVGQLNVGFELEKGHQRFVAMENSSIGYCEVEIKISRPGYGRGSSSMEDGDLELVFHPEREDTVPLGRAALWIDKVRRPKKCPNRKIYFFGNRDDLSRGVNGTYMDLMTSTSEMRISEHEFHSHTESTGVMKTESKSRTMGLYQKISLNLKSINSAKNSMPEIPNPASTSIYAYLNLEDE